MMGDNVPKMLLVSMIWCFNSAVIMFIIGMWLSR